MKFEEMISALKRGEKVRKPEWNQDKYMCLEDRKIKVIIECKFKRVEGQYIFRFNDLYSEWEIARKFKSVRLRDMTKEQFERWQTSNCHGTPLVGATCKNCIFKDVVCYPNANSVWVKHKELYSDKFLSQEVEVDD